MNGRKRESQRRSQSRATGAAVGERSEPVVVVVIREPKAVGKVTKAKAEKSDGKPAVTGTHRHRRISCQLETLTQTHTLMANDDSHVFGASTKQKSRALPFVWHSGKKCWARKKAAKEQSREEEEDGEDDNNNLETHSRQPVSKSEGFVCGICRQIRENELLYGLHYHKICFLQLHRSV